MPPQYKEGDTATNPDTGQKYAFRDGQWAAIPMPGQPGYVPSLAYTGPAQQPSLWDRIKGAISPADVNAAMTAGGLPTGAGEELAGLGSEAISRISPYAGRAMAAVEGAAPKVVGAAGGAYEGAKYGERKFGLPGMITGGVLGGIGGWKGGGLIGKVNDYLSNALARQAAEKEGGSAIQSVAQAAQQEGTQTAAFGPHGFHLHYPQEQKRLIQMLGEPK